MGKVICVSNQKGGVGKTTTTNGLAMSLKHRGFRVLCVDFDPQGNLSFSLGADNRFALQNTIYHVLKGEMKVGQAIQHTALANVIPANILLSGIELEFTSLGREKLLRNALRPVAHLYDYILIDSPPALGILTLNVFTASNAVIMPVLSDLFSLQGIVQLHDTILKIREKSNPDLQFGGVLLTRFDPRHQISSVVRETVVDMARSLDIPLLDTFIHSSVVLSKAQILRKDIMTYAPQNKAVLDYKSLTGELLKRGVL